MSNEIDTGDHVHHGPSNEDWVVACVDGEYLHWCGWPEGEAKLSDCTLIRKATSEERVERPRALVPVDLGRLGYRCSRCGGEFTSTDAMTCRCPERQAECERTKQDLKEWLEYKQLVWR